MRLNKRAGPVTIHIINPNSSRRVTDGIDAAIDPLRALSPVPILCHQIDAAPPGIETQADVDAAAVQVLDRAAGLAPGTSAFVIACFSDPGLAALRASMPVPVMGIAESAVLTAMTLGQRFGLLSILRGSVPRHLRYLGAMGVTDRLAGDLPLDLGVADLADTGRTFARLVEVGRELRDRHGAEVLILGCAGMAGQRAALEKALDCPVIDPCQAAVAMAIGRVALAHATAPHSLKEPA